MRIRRRKYHSLLTLPIRRSSTPYDSPDLHFDCPSNVSSFDVWKEATPMLGRKGYQANGAGCTAKTKYNGTSSLRCNHGARPTHAESTHTYRHSRFLRRRSRTGRSNLGL